jgi:cell division protein FtsQ
VDMRYERQVVLEMQPGAGVPVASSPNGAAVMAADSKAAAAPAPGTSAGETKPATKAAAKPRVAVHPAAVKHASTVKGRPAAKAPAKKFDPKAKKSVVVAKHHPVVDKPSAGSTQYHPSQAVQP